MCARIPTLYSKSYANENCKKPVLARRRVTQEFTNGIPPAIYADVELGDMFHSGALDAVVSFGGAGFIHVLHNDSTIAPVAVDDNPVTAPQGYALGQTFPNPSSHQASVTYTLPTAQQAMLAIADATGRFVKILTNGFVESGTHEIAYDCSGLASGTYYLRLLAANATLAKPFVVTH